MRSRLELVTVGRYHPTLSLLLDDLDAGVEGLHAEFHRRELARAQPEARA